MSLWIKQKEFEIKIFKSTRVHNTIGVISLWQGFSKRNSTEEFVFPTRLIDAAIANRATLFERVLVHPIPRQALRHKIDAERSNSVARCPHQGKFRI